MKTCKKCGQEKSIDDFHRHPENKDRRQTACKKCRLEHSKEHNKKMQAKNAEVIRTGRVMRCIQCEEYKTDYDFSTDRTYKHGLKHVCKICDAKNCKTSKYGLTHREQDALYAAQKNKCPICHAKLEVDKKSHFDHCHATGKVRGILCGPCNQAIGLFKENTDAMLNAVKYLQSGGLSI